MFSQVPANKPYRRNRRRRVSSRYLAVPHPTYTAGVYSRLWIALTYAERINWSKDTFWVEAFYSVGALYDAAVITINTVRSMSERRDIPVLSKLPTVRLNLIQVLLIT